MTDNIWDDPELRVGGEYVKFDEPGDSITGTVLAVRKHRFDDGKVAPSLLIRTADGEERTLTAGQVRLAAELADKRPGVGDVLTVTYTKKEPRAGGKTLKHFDVAVKRGDPADAQTPPF